MSQPLKVLFVVQNYSPSLGGTQTLIQSIAEKLVNEYKAEVQVATTDSLYGPEKNYFVEINPKEEEINGVKVIRFSFYKWHKPILKYINKFYAKFAWRLPDFLYFKVVGPWSPKMISFLKSSTADVVCGSPSSYAYMLYPIFNKDKPFVFMGALHFTEGEKTFIHPKTISAIQHSAFYISNTAYEKKMLINHWGIQEEKIKVVGCGVEIQKFSQPSNIHQFDTYKKNNGKIVSYIGRLHPSKNILHVINALELLWVNNEPITFIIAGAKTPYIEVIQKRITQLPGKFQSNVKILTNISEDEKCNLMHASDVFVSLSTAESFGIVFLEAWACKTPVIGANIGAVASVIDDGKDGFLVEASNAEQVAKKINQLLTDSLLNQSFGSKGYQKVLEKYTWDIIAKKYQEIFIEAIERKKICVE